MFHFGRPVALSSSFVYSLQLTFCRTLFTSAPSSTLSSYCYAFSHVALSLKIAGLRISCIKRYILCISNSKPRGAWTHSAWGPCSATCGDGSKTRVVACTKIGSKEVIDETFCKGRKPKAVKKCNRKRCQKEFGFWVFGQWSEVSIKFLFIFSFFIVVIFVHSNLIIIIIIIIIIIMETFILNSTKYNSNLT